MQTLRLASAALFREQDGVFREASASDGTSITRIRSRPTILSSPRASRKVPMLISAGASLAELPNDLERPVLVVPVGNSRRCYALVLYGGHEIGTDLDAGERRLIASLAHNAEIAYAQVESETLRRRVAMLEAELAKTLEPR